MPCTKGMRGCHSRCLHRDRVEGYYLERDTQERRAEEQTIGYDTETELYFDPRNGVEKRLTFKDWLIMSANPNREEPVHDEAEAA